jgi:4-hydroxy-tetrahydrodipicolinate reductase
MTPKIAIYGTGQYALEAVRIIVEKGWDIVAAYNRSGAKVGRDLGELAGLPKPMGIIIEDCETADYAASGANIAIHSVGDRLDYNWPGYERLTSAGINIICHAGESYFPWGSRPELADKLDAMAKNAGVTFTGTGIWDSSRIWSGLIAAGTASRLEGLDHRTLTNGEAAGLELLKVCGGTFTRQEFAEQNESLLAGIYKTVPHQVLWALGLDVISVVEERVPVIDDKPVYSHALGRDIEPGICLGTRITTRVTTREGINALSINELRVLRPGETEHMIWEVKGRPTTKIRVDRSDSLHSSSACMVNRIPDVLAAEPGIQVISKLGPIRPQGITGGSNHA